MEGRRSKKELRDFLTVPNTVLFFLWEFLKVFDNNSVVNHPHYYNNIVSENTRAFVTIVYYVLVVGVHSGIVYIVGYYGQFLLDCQHGNTGGLYQTMDV